MIMNLETTIEVTNADDLDVSPVIVLPKKGTENAKNYNEDNKC